VLDFIVEVIFYLSCDRVDESVTAYRGVYRVVICEFCFL
jgi:hypothetical protein